MKNQLRVTADRAAPRGGGEGIVKELRCDPGSREVFKERLRKQHRQDCIELSAEFSGEKSPKARFQKDVKEHRHHPCAVYGAPTDPAKLERWKENMAAYLREEADRAPKAVVIYRIEEAPELSRKAIYTPLQDIPRAVQLRIPKPFPGRPKPSPSSPGAYGGSRYASLTDQLLATARHGHRPFFRARIPGVGGEWPEEFKPFKGRVSPKRADRRRTSIAPIRREPDLYEIPDWARGDVLDQVASAADMTDEWIAILTFCSAAFAGRGLSIPLMPPRGVGARAESPLSNVFWLADDLDRELGLSAHALKAEEERLRATLRARKDSPRQIDQTVARMPWAQQTIFDQMVRLTVEQDPEVGPLLAEIAASGYTSRELRNQLIVATRLPGETIIAQHERTGLSYSAIQRARKSATE